MNSDPITDEANEHTPPTRVASRIERIVFRYKKVFFFAGLTWLGLLLAGGLVLSGVDARAGLHIFGSQKWVAGHSASLRLSLEDIQYGIKKQLQSVTARLRQDGFPDVIEHTLSQTAGLFVQGSIPVPDRVGPWTLELTTDDIDTPLLAKVPIQVMPPNKYGSLLTDNRPGDRSRSGRGPVRLDLRPLDGEVPGELPSALILTADIGGQAHPCRVSIDVKEGYSKIGLPDEIEIPTSGYAVIDLHSVRPSWDIALRAGTSQADISFSPEAHQYRIETSGLVTGNQIEFTIYSIFKEGPLFIDLWLGKQWLRTVSGHLDNYSFKGQLELPSFVSDGQAVWLQAYGNTYQPGNNRGGRHLLVAREGRANAIANLDQSIKQTKFEGIPPMARRNQATMDASSYSRALLGTLKWPKNDPPLLADSGVTVRQTVTHMKRTWQRRFVVIFVISALLLMGVVLILLFRNQREVSAGWTAYSDTGGAVAGTRRNAMWDAVIVICVLAAFLVGLVTLVTFVRW